MTAVNYPIAPNAETALASPVGRAPRERSAHALAGVEVRFMVEETGPAFETREAALDAYAGRLDDERAGKRTAVPPEDRFCALREVLAPSARRTPPRTVEPLLKDGRRWPVPKAPPKTVWRLSVSYWRILCAEEQAAVEQARLARKQPQAAELDRDSLRAMSRLPLRPVKPQQPLDIGLFEAPIPEDPGHVIPDE